MSGNDIGKNLILLRGLPGSGKSTLARVLSEHGKYSVFSVDSYFTNSVSGEYLFNYKENHIAYRECERRTREAMMRGEEKIFVDNTFTIEWEIEPYMRMAAEYGYSVHVVTVENRHGGANTHGISDDQISRMAGKYKVILK
jgi:predicted kinase